MTNTITETNHRILSAQRLSGRGPGEPNRWHGLDFATGSGILRLSADSADPAETVTVHHLAATGVTGVLRWTATFSGSVPTAAIVATMQAAFGEGL